MLHGTIDVNRKTIATWSARRLVDPPQEVNPYEVHVSYVDMDGLVHSMQTRLSHHFGDGALRLVAEITDWAATELARMGVVGAVDAPVPQG